MIERLKRHYRSVLLLCVSIVALTGGVWWLIHADCPRVIQNRYLQGPITSYMGVNIGDTREEVLYKIGKPPYVFGAAACEVKERCYWSVYSTNTELDNIKKDAPKSGKDLWNFNVYLYENEASNNRKELLIQFRKNKVKMIRCINQCSKLIGLSIKTRESIVYRILGKPNKEYINPESGEKTMSYEKYNLVLMLRKQEVYLLSVQKVNDQEFDSPPNWFW